MINFNKIMLIEDLSYVQNFIISGGKLIAIADEIDNTTIDQYGMMHGSALLPPYDAISSLADGDISTFNSLYMEHLNKPDNDFFLVAILTAAMSGIPIGLYFGDINDMTLNADIFQTFATFVYNKYGICIESSRVPFGYNEMYDSFILNAMYGYGLIPVNEYLIRYPENCIQNISCFIGKIFTELNLPYIEGWTNDNWIRYFSEYKKNLMRTNCKIETPFSQR